MLLGMVFHLFRPIAAAEVSVSVFIGLNIKKTVVEVEFENDYHGECCRSLRTKPFLSFPNFNS